MREERLQTSDFRLQTSESRIQKSEGRGQAGGLLLLSSFVILFLAGCSTPKPVALDPEIKGLADSAAAAYHRGEIERAEALWQKALQRARLIDDRGEIVRNAYNLGLCRLVAGRYEEAMRVLKQAEALAGGKGVELSRILLAESEAARLEGVPSESEQRALEAVAAGADREGRVQALVLQGEAEFSSGRLLTALEHYRVATSILSENTPALLRARLDELAVHLVQAKLLPGDEAAFMISRAEWLKKAGQYTMMAVALDGAANRYAEDSKWEQAFDCRIRAVQSLIAAGRRSEALAMLKKAADLAGRTGDARSKVLVAELAGELK